MQAGLPS
nr:ORF2 [Rattus norvegicus]